MIPKPEACKGCPLYGTGYGYVPDESRDNSSVYILGQNPGAEEEAAGRPFVGKTGTSMETYLSLAGLKREGVSIANAVRCRWQNSNELPELGKKDKIAETAIEHCRRAYFKPPQSCRLLVAQGEHALYSSTGERGITSWRGWLLPLSSTGLQSTLREVWSPKLGQIPVLATIHLAALFHQQSLSYPTRMDWLKVPKVLAGQWPSEPPGWVTDPPRAWPRVSAFDTEYDPTTGSLERYSLYDGEHLYVVEAGTPHPYLEMPEDATVILHHAEADLTRLSHLVDGPPAHLEDTMLMDAVLWTDRPHDLEFLGSLYAPINRWKHLQYVKRGKVISVNPQQYSAMDAFGTWHVYQALRREMDADASSEWVYRNAVAPLTPINMESESTGLGLSQDRVLQARTHFQCEADDLQLQAAAHVGWPINLGSPDQMAHQLYTIEGIGKKRSKK